jgi:predicted ATPase
MLIAASILLLIFLMFFEYHFSISCIYFPHKEGIQLTLKLDIKDITIKKKVEDYTKAIIYKRAKKMGVRCVRITSNYEGIIVKLPGVNDTQEAEVILKPLKRLT